MAGIAITEAKEDFVDVTGNGKSEVPIRLWMRTWGNRQAGMSHCECICVRQSVILQYLALPMRL